LSSDDRTGSVRAEVTEVPTPTAGPGELLVEMKTCGLCGTDIEKAKGEYKAALPILGHEAVGLVSEVGQGVKEFRRGDRVFPHHHVPCHECYYCRSGDETSCLKYRTSNIFPGGFSEFFRVPAWNVAKGGVLRLPQGLDFREASLIEPVGCCIRALNKCKLRKDDTVLIVGAGPVGILHSILLRLKGAKTIISDISEQRLLFAEKLGVERTIDVRNRNVTKEVNEWTNGRGADAVIVASGNPAAIKQALESVRNAGKVCLFGVPSRGSVLDYDFSDLYNREVSLFPSYGATESEIGLALSQIETNHDIFRSLITHDFPIIEYSKAVDVVTSGAGTKVLITS